MGKRKLKTMIARLNVIASGDEPPKEFRIFKRGLNETMKGNFIFDDDAAVAVMAAYAVHGVDRMIDLEHFSMPDENEQVKDPDARGWCNLELRENGELWAVNVKWTPDGEERLRSKKQRYISPVFTYNSDSLQILTLYNLAICAIPATYQAPALVAASARNKIGVLSIEVKKMEVLKAVCAALGLKDDSTLDEALAAIKAFQEDDGGGDDSKDKPAPKTDEEKAAADDPKDAEKMNTALAALPPKIRGAVFAAMAAKDTLSKDVAELKAKQTQTEVESFVARNTDKIPLHLEKWALGQPIAVLKSFVENAVSAPRAATQPTQGGGAAPVTGEVVLTEADKHFAKLTSIPEADFLATKKKLAEKERLQRS